MTDLIIGMASGYTDEDLRPFVNSLKRTGYEGDLVLIRQNPLNIHPIVARFDLIPRYIEHQRYVIACDTSDIVFQADPITWLEQHAASNELVFTCENVKFCDSEGNKKNLLEAFGRDIYEKYQNSYVFNAGVIAGKARCVKELCEKIYLLCLQDARPQVPATEKLTWDKMMCDQSALNILMDDFPCVLKLFDDSFVHNYSHTGRGENAAILHQYLYGRKEEIREKYK